MFCALSRSEAAVAAISSAPPAISLTVVQRRAKAPFRSARVRSMSGTKGSVIEVERSPSANRPIALLSVSTDFIRAVMSVANLMTR